MPINLVEPYDFLPNLSIIMHGSDGIFRILPVSSLMGCLSSLIDRKRIPMSSVIDSICYRPGFWISSSSIR